MSSVLIMSAWRTEVTLQPRPDLPPLRMTVHGERVTPGAGQRDYPPEFAAWCRAAALAERYSGMGAQSTIERMRPRFEAWYGEDFASCKLQKLGIQVRKAVAATLQPLIEHEMLHRYGALIGAALAASLEDSIDDPGAA